MHPLAAINSNIQQSYWYQKIPNPLLLTFALETKIQNSPVRDHRTNSKKNKKNVLQLHINSQFSPEKKSHMFFSIKTNVVQLSAYVNMSVDQN